MTIDVVSRTDWKAQDATGEITLADHPFEYVIYTHNLEIPKCHTDEECAEACRNLQKKHIEAGAPDIYYNFLIGGNGKAYEGRGWWKQPDPSLAYPEYKGKRIDIAYIGFYGTHNDLPMSMECMGAKLVQNGIDFMYIHDDPVTIGGDDHCPCETEVVIPPPEDENVVG